MAINHWYQITPQDQSVNVRDGLLNLNNVEKFIRFNDRTVNIHYVSNRMDQINFDHKDQCDTFWSKLQDDLRQDR